jgi:DNA-nicking Smr family endonuclease
MKNKLTPEDLHLWHINMKDVKPLQRIKKHADEKKQSTALPLKPKPALGAPPVKQKIKLPSVPILQPFQRKELRHVEIDARFDMHGMSLAEAYDALEKFLTHAQTRKFKRVLVITGKGAISSENTLRHQLPRWLEEAPLRNLVIGFHYPAKPHHGGHGAYYVRVKGIS